MSGLTDRFAGSLLGLALGDALGAPHEGGPVGQALWWALGLGRGDTLRWTDDTQMALGLAESLVERNGLDPDHVARAWAEAADWKRGYGPGARRLLAMIRAGTDWREANTAVFPDGSYGNGAAMRVAPVGLFHHERPEALDRDAKASSVVTHAHPLAVEGALLIARATAAALHDRIDLAELAKGCAHREYAEALEHAGGEMERGEVRRRLGAGVEAHRSVVTALHVAARFREFTPMIEFVISLGGDTDTIGAMAGAVFGARWGRAALPAEPLSRLESRERIEETAAKLHAASRTGA